MNQEIQNLNYCNKAIEIKKDIEINFITLAEYLYNIKEHNLFEPQWDSFVEFSMELKMSSNMINKLVQMYKTLVLGYGITFDEIATAGGWSAVKEVLPAITSKSEAVKWLGKAGTLTRSDIRKELIERKTGVSMSKCKHVNTYLLEICKDCGDKHQVFKN